MYIDDVIVSSEMFEEDISRLEDVFERLSLATLRLEQRYCFLFKQEVEVLDHAVTLQGVQTDPAKITKVVNWPISTSIGEVRSALGFCGYYTRSINYFSNMASPLHALTSGKAEDFDWST